MSPIIGFYALLAKHLEHGRGTVPYSALEAAYHKTKTRNTFDGHVMGALRLESQWNWRLPGQAILEPHDSLRQVARQFLRGAFADLAVLKRHEKTSMETYRNLAHQVLQKEEENIVLWAEKFVMRGSGATLLMHVSDWKGYLDCLMKTRSYGQISVNGMLLETSKP